MVATAAAPPLGPLHEGAAPKRGWGLRRRILLMFAVGALALSLLLAFLTYGCRLNQYDTQALREEVLCVFGPQTGQQVSQFGLLWL